MKATLAAAFGHPASRLGVGLMPSSSLLVANRTKPPPWKNGLGVVATGWGVAGDSAVVGERPETRLVLHGSTTEGGGWALRWGRTRWGADAAAGVTVIVGKSKAGHRCG